MVSQNRQSPPTGRSASVSPSFCLQYSKVRDLPHASNYIKSTIHISNIRSNVGNILQCATQAKMTDQQSLEREDQYANSNSSNNKSSINKLPTTSSIYSSLPSITPQQFQQNTSLPPQTLPQSQAQHATLSMRSMYGQPLSAPTLTQPSTPGTTGNGGSQQMNSQSTSRQYQLQPNSSYQQPILPYSNNSLGMMPQGSRSMSHQHTQGITSPPGPTQNRCVPLRPMNPTTPLHAQHPMHQQMRGMESPYGQQGPCHKEVPTHAVGWQGRRGILPSAPGHPSVIATDQARGNNALIPAKDADGRFPCPHCDETYLHAKHLKRHFLRRKF